MSSATSPALLLTTTTRLRVTHMSYQIVVTSSTRIELSDIYLHTPSQTMQKEERVIIIGAAGRDFHDFLVYWKDKPETKVECFTAEQIPGIANRTFPKELCGPGYPTGIKILPEYELPDLIRLRRITTCAMAYSDLHFNTVMTLAATCNANGANFVMLSPHQTWLKSSKPVIAVCAVRTGAGKSQTTRYICNLLKKQGKKVAVVRHPMPYGDLLAQRVQRFEKMEDLIKHRCTIEEREEYETHIEAGNLLFAGVDYAAILKQAEQEADVILWDGGNNDAPFYKPDLHICVADALRAGHEHAYYPGETNARMAHLLMINKCNSGDEKTIAALETSLAKTSMYGAPIIRCNSVVSGFAPESKEPVSALIKGKRVLVIEDGPSVTHGGLPHGAGYTLAQQEGAATILDPRTYAQGSIKSTFAQYSHLTLVLPAMGYSDKQIADLQASIDAAAPHCDVFITGTPTDLAKLIKFPKPFVRVRYELAPKAPTTIETYIQKALKRKADDLADEQKQREVANTKELTALLATEVKDGSKTAQMRSAFSQVFASLPVASLARPASGVIEINSNATILSAVRKLAAANIFAMPVKTVESKAQDQGQGSYKGIITMLDIVWFVLGVMKRTQTWTKGFEQELETAESLASTTVQTVLDSLERGKFLPLTENGSLLEIMALLGKYKQHRAVICSQNTVTNVITQSAMLNMVKSLIDKTPRLAAFTSLSLKELGLAEPKTVHSVALDSPAMTAFATIQKERVSAVPVLDKDGVIVGNVSARDIRSMVCKPQFIGRINDSLQEFLSEVQADKKDSKIEVLLSPVTATPADSLGSIIDKFVSHQIHRVYIVDEKRKPISVVTLTDVIATLVNEPSDFAQ